MPPKQVRKPPTTTTRAVTQTTTRPIAAPMKHPLKPPAPVPAATVRKEPLPLLLHDDTQLDGSGLVQDTLACLHSSHSSGTNLANSLSATYVFLQSLSDSLATAGESHLHLVQRLAQAEAESTRLAAQATNLEQLLEAERVLNMQMLLQMRSLETQLHASSDSQHMHSHEAASLAQRAATAESTAAGHELKIVQLQRTLKDRDAALFSLRSTTSDLEHEVRQCMDKIHAMSTLKSENAQLAHEKAALQHKLTAYEHTSQGSTYYTTLPRSRAMATPLHKSIPAAAEADLLVFEGLSEIERPAFLNDEESTADNVFRHLHGHVERLEKQLFDHSIS
ncbi:hypothetical protein BASA50_009687 [Batrachochytrium salamandrivorans]|uniref:Uncharacterized protein n=1 Tax=Batrachochytrium salamandrivorans TaxID=1357716 RepID=A0ABQ8F0M3_9FUNG|nr:hypothetical protein BASA62_010428 [Batrachochytrium salamandrivorans]KAH6564542.1 hypothetical protein BASA60_010289 [Batrachochytrium salamandrivorans]KAH6581946.1 hypothetical protein BASA61_008834 [Batrachochytrium salamandrivorans]KAH6589986.1 hypothetical protein BASA50_009687 [Batrachochytrium salamandrivorans]KAH9270228.1 hypothetical protein BASA83_007565 [Batrachochytrium salamandrivorans]